MVFHGRFWPWGSDSSEHHFVQHEEVAPARDLRHIDTISSHLNIFIWNNREKNEWPCTNELGMILGLNCCNDGPSCSGELCEFPIRIVPFSWSSWWSSWWWWWWWDYLLHFSAQNLGRIFLVMSVGTMTLPIQTSPCCMLTYPCSLCNSSPIEVRWKKNLQFCSSVFSHFLKRNFGRVLLSVFPRLVRRNFSFLHLQHALSKRL